MQRHLEQSTLAMLDDLRQTLDRHGIQLSIRGHDAQAAGLFGDQLSPIGQKRNRPRIFEPLAHQCFDAIIVQLGFDDLVRRGHRKFHPFDERLLFLLAQKNHQAANLFRREHTLPRDHAKLWLSFGDRPRDVLIGAAMFPLAIHQRTTLPAFKRSTMACGAMHPVYLLGLDLVCQRNTTGKQRN